MCLKQVVILRQIWEWLSYYGTSLTVEVLQKISIVWDVGHQAYVHKILTGRKKGFKTLRKFGGLSGFPKPCESEYDSFATGHSSTSISAALGMALVPEI